LKTLAESQKNVDTSLQSINAFKAQIYFFESKIKRSEQLLPQLKRDIKRIEDGLPEWKKEVQIYRKSLSTHIGQLAKQQTCLNLLIKRKKVLAQIRKLEKSK